MRLPHLTVPSASSKRKSSAHRCRSQVADKRTECSSQHPRHFVTPPTRLTQIRPRFSRIASVLYTGTETVTVSLQYRIEELLNYIQPLILSCQLLYLWRIATYADSAGIVNPMQKSSIHTRCCVLIEVGISPSSMNELATTRSTHQAREVEEVSSVSVNS